MPNEDKKEIRERIRTLLQNQGVEKRVEKSLAIQSQLFEMPQFIKSKVILFYASFRDEVDTFKMMKKAMESGKTLALPKIIDTQKKIMTAVQIDNLDKDLHIGHYGILEPMGDSLSEIPVDQLDMVIVPGIAFDEDNFRLGQGAGYYDRFLNDVSSTTATVGLAFDFQVLNTSLPREDHDIALSSVLSA